MDAHQGLARLADVNEQFLESKAFDADQTLRKHFFSSSLRVSPAQVSSGF
jgi:hypothetical protein